jgi:hypothetical protein
MHSGIAVIMAVMRRAITVVMAIMTIARGIRVCSILLSCSGSIAGGISGPATATSTSYAQGGDQEQAQHGREEVRGKDRFTHVPWCVGEMGSVWRSLEWLGEALVRMAIHGRRSVSIPPR